MASNDAILIVDDEQPFRESLRDILEAKGFRVHTAEDAEVGLAQVEQHKYGLVVMDVRMPRKDGPEALLGMKSLCPELPVIMVTAYRLDEGQHHEVVETAAALFTKPLDMDAFLKVVDRYCRHEAVSATCGGPPNSARSSG